MEIAVFLTGGTIAMKPKADGHGAAPGGDLDAVIAHELSIPGVSVRTVHWSDKPSPHMSPKDMLLLARDVERQLDHKNICGAIVVHGTDLLVETSYLLDLVLASKKPVVTTGSMRHMEEAGYDGKRNLLNSLLACLALPRSSEVLVQIADQLFTARDAVKLDSVSVAPFIGQRRGSVGRIAGDKVQLTQEVRCKRPRLPFTVDSIAENVPLITCYPGMQADVFEALLGPASSPNIAGLVIEGFGAGNVPPDIVPALKRATAQSIPVVLTTRCVLGGVWPLYGYLGGAENLFEFGVISAGNLSGTKAQLLLKLAIASGCSQQAIKEVFV